MTVQLSVTLWTLISFFVFAVLLDRFLFRPIFKVMDERTEKIERRAAEREKALRLMQEKKLALEQAKEEQEKIKKDISRKKEEEERLAEEKQVKDALAERERLLAEATLLTEREKEQWNTLKDDVVGNMAKIFAERLLGGKEL